MGNTSSKEEVNLSTKIGEGSYAVVYKAVWNNKQVAAKKLHNYLLGKTDVKQKFKEEWELLSGLNHPNIVKYLTAVIPESPRESTIIVTELMEQDLRQFIMRSQTNPKVTFRDTVSIMLDVAKGLKYLHQLPTPIVHRDLACKNILLNATKQAKIADFGIAKCFPGGEMAATGNLGTPATRAPETFGKWRFRREKKKYGTKADIFSFGVVLLEVIVGHPSVRISELHTEDGRIVPEAFRRSEDLYEMELEHPLRPLVLQCLENNPDHRPTAHDLVDAVSVFKENNDFHRSQDDLHCRGPIHRIADGRYDYEFKVVMVGDQGVGKTSIATKFVRPNLPFQDRLPSTIAHGEYNERLQLKGKSILLQIVDTSGHFDTTSSLPLLYRGSHGAAVVFDVGSSDSLVSVSQWVSMVREKCGYEIPIILVGNKTDSEPREVNFETAENMSLEFNLFYIEVSAKTGVNIEETFSVLTEQLMQQRDLGYPSSSSPSTSAASSPPNISPRRYEPPARITTREQVPRKRIQRDPDSISLKPEDENGNRDTSPAVNAGAKKRSCCSK